MNLDTMYPLWWKLQKRLESNFRTNLKKDKVSLATRKKAKQKARKKK